MKKFLLILLMVAFTVSFVFGENESVNETQKLKAPDDVQAPKLTDQDQEELKVFEDHWGARMRMLQLEKALMRNILIGGQVIEVIETNHEEVDTSLLNSILADMESLLEDVRAMDFEGTAEELAEEFITVKQLSVNLSLEFKLEANNFLTGEDRAAVRNAVKHVDSGLKSIHDEIMAAKHKYNAQRMLSFMKKFGVEDEDIVAMIETGEMTKNQAKQAIINAMKEVKQVAQKAKNVVARQAHKQVQVVGNATQNLSAKFKSKYGEVVENRLLRGSQQLEIASNRTAQRARVLDEEGFANRAKRLESISNQLGMQAVRLEERAARGKK